MKQLYNILSFLCFTSFLSAQSENTFSTTTIEENSFEAQKIVDAKRHYLNMMADERSLFKIGFESMSMPVNKKVSFDLPISNGLFVSYEHRLGTSFSINARLSYHRATVTTLYQKRLTYALKGPIMQRFSVEINPRWYFMKRKRIETKEIGNNLTGLYMGTTLGIQHFQSPGHVRVTTSDGRNYNPFLKSNHQYSTINLGWQRRFSERGFVHAQLEAGVRHNELINFPEELLAPEIVFEQLPKWQSIVTYKIGLGFALSHAEETSVRQPILEYHQQDVTMWKMDLLPILLSFGGDNPLSKINIGYEFGIKQSSFSINTNLTYLFYPNEGDYKLNHLAFQLSPRLYYNLKNRIRKGKTANNLSADYFSIRNQWNIISSNYLNEQKVSFAFLWGIQRRLFEHLFINYQFGYETGLNGAEYLFNNYIISELKIGLAF